LYPASQWTNELPTEDGWYWIKWVSTGKVEAIHVFRKEGMSPGFEWWIDYGSEVYRYAEDITEDGEVIPPLRWKTKLEPPK
jgi:hypothetical protein